ncbi:MAG: chitinase N-terminal domain-containing protein [Moraxellaceae bacterium]
MFRSLSLFAALAAAVLLSACGTEQKLAPTAAVTAPVIKDGSLMTPGKPQIAPMRGRAVPGAQPITWNMYWGENGRHWAVYVNGKEVQSGDLASETPKQQQATVDVSMDQPGTYEIKVALCNDHGCSESEPAVMNVGAG